MDTKLKGTTWRIRYALQRNDNPKNELVANTMEEIYKYVAMYNEMDEKAVKEAFEKHDDHELEMDERE